MNAQAYATISIEYWTDLSGMPRATVVVMHRETETYWGTDYGVPRADRSATWTEVEPIVETNATYRRKLFDKLPP